MAGPTPPSSPPTTTPLASEGTDETLRLPNPAEEEALRIARQKFAEVRAQLIKDLEEIGRAIRETTIAAATDIETVSEESFGKLIEQIDAATESTKRHAYMMNNEVARAYGTSAAKGKAYQENLDASIQKTNELATAMRSELLPVIQELDQKTAVYNETQQRLADEQELYTQKAVESARNKEEAERIQLDITNRLTEAQNKLADAESERAAESVRHEAAKAKVEETDTRIRESLILKEDDTRKYMGAVAELNKILSDGDSITQEHIDTIQRNLSIGDDETDLLDKLNEYTRDLNEASDKRHTDIQRSIDDKIRSLNTDKQSIENQKTEHAATVAATVEEHNLNIERRDGAAATIIANEAEIRALVTKRNLLTANISLKEAELIRDKNLKNVTLSMSTYIDRITGATSSSNFFSSAILGSLTGVKSFKEGIGNLADSMGAGFTAAFMDPEKAIARLTNYIKKNVVDSSFEFDKAISQVNKTTGGFGKEFEKVAFNTQGAFKEQSMVGLSKYGLGLSDVAKTFNELNSKISNFNNLTNTQKRELTANAAQLSQLGVSASDYGQLVGQFIGGLGKTVEGAKHEINMLARDAIAAGKDVAAYAKEFAKLSPILSGYGREARTLFKELNAIAKQTSGLVDAADLSNLAEQFSTFDGATESTAKLNAALKSTQLNFMDLMESDPSERITKIVEAYKRSGQEFDRMNIGYKRLLAESLGFGKDVQKASAFLKMDTSKMYAEMNKTAASQAELEERTKRSADAQERLTKAVESMKIAFSPIVEAVGKFADMLSTGIEKLGGFKSTMLAIGILAIPAVMGAWKLFTMVGGKMFKSFANAVNTDIKDIIKELSRAVDKAKELRSVSGPGGGGGGRGGGGGGGGSRGGGGGGGMISDIAEAATDEVLDEVMDRVGGGGGSTGGRGGGRGGRPPRGGGRMSRIGGSFSRGAKAVGGFGKKIASSFKGFSKSDMLLMGVSMVAGSDLFSGGTEKPRRDSVSGFSAGVVGDDEGDMSAPTQLEDGEQDTINPTKLLPKPAGRAMQKVPPNTNFIKITNGEETRNYKTENVNDHIAVVDKRAAAQQAAAALKSESTINKTSIFSPSQNVSAAATNNLSSFANSQTNNQLNNNSLSEAVTRMSNSANMLSDNLNTNSTTYSSATTNFEKNSQNLNNQVQVLGSNVIKETRNITGVAQSGSNIEKAIKESTNISYEKALEKTAESTRELRERSSGIGKTEMQTLSKEITTAFKNMPPALVEVKGDSEGLAKFINAESRKVSKEEIQRLGSRAT